jgi:hypothetical protein
LSCDCKQFYLYTVSVTHFFKKKNEKKSEKKEIIHIYLKLSMSNCIKNILYIYISNIIHSSHHDHADIRIQNQIHHLKSHLHAKKNQSNVYVLYFFSL